VSGRAGNDGSRGLVSLVGAGPGDPDLLTLAGRDRLAAADVVVYDRLIDPTLLRHAPARAELRYVGKASGDHSVPQEKIVDLLIDRARSGKCVVRLKGGDPFVFGRGGEEAEALAEAGLAFDIVPGISSAIAAAAYAGIPLTHRDASSSFAAVTGHEDAAKSESTIDWGRLSTATDTLVVLMGLRALPAIAARLIEEGRSPDTPAAAIASGTTPRQRVVSATLATLAEAVAEAKLESPVLTVVGEVVRYRATLRWYDSTRERPLFGKSVLVTRSRAQASRMVERLRREGAEPLEFPTIEIVPSEPGPIDQAIDDLAGGAYDWVIFTSANGVRLFFERLATIDADGMEIDARIFAGSEIAVIGSETAAALNDHGLRADVIPERFVAESLLEAFAQHELRDIRILLARAAEARDTLPDGLRQRGASVDDVALYENRHPTQADPEVIARLKAGSVEIATFSASSTVRGCLEMLDGRAELLRNAFIACIGPVTAQTAIDAGLHVDLVSEVHTIPGLIDALRTHFANPSEPKREGVQPHA